MMCGAKVPRIAQGSSTHLRLLMKKKNMKWKKYRNTEHEDGELNT